MPIPSRNLKHFCKQKAGPGDAGPLSNYQLPGRTNLKLQTVKRVLWGLCALAILLMLLYMLTKSVASIISLAAVLLGMLLFERTYWRCPHCGRFLGRLDAKASFYPFCGEKLEL